MTELTWTPTMETGNAEIDADHRQLFDAVREIKSSLDKGDLASCGELVGRFVAAAEGHFHREEALLGRLHYPNLEDHKVYHRSLLTNARKLREVCAAEHDRDRAEACYIETVAFLLDDVVRGDHEFKSYLDERGSVKARG